MTKSNEGDPTQGVVDIDTFRYYVIGYTADVLANPPHRDLTLLGINRDFPELEELGPQIRLENCSWENVPETIQEVLMMSYESAKLPGEKHVTAIISRREIIFNLSSPSLNMDVDLFGETWIPFGVGLQLSDNPEFVFASKGNWYFNKHPAKTYMAMRGKTADEKREIFRNASNLSQVIPHTLHQLHDLVKLFEQSRENIVVVY